MTTTEIRPPTKPGPELAAAAEPAAGAAPARHQRFHAWLAEQGATLPRFVTERQPSFEEHVRLAHDGEWTTQPAGAGRRFRIAWTYTVALSFAALGAYLAWAGRTPGRLLPLVVVVTFLTTALNTLPVLHWLIPDWATWTAWPPISWLVS